MEKVGLGFLGAPAAPEMARLAQRAEEVGFESVWLAETRFERDAITAATTVALATSRLRVGTAALNVFTRGAALTAVTMAALDELSGGRAVLGIGSGSGLVLAAQGYRYDRPLPRLRDTVSAIRAVWHGEDFAGEFAQIEGVRLDFAPLRPSIPVYLAVSGPLSLTYAGGVADGVILDTFMPVDHVRAAAERVRGAAEVAGRDPRTIEIAGMVMIALDTLDRSGRDRVAPMLSRYLTTFPTIAPAAGVPDEAMAAYLRIAAAEGIGALATRLPHDVVDALTVIGSPQRCVDRIQDYRDAGLGLPILVPLPDQIEDVITAIGRGIGPRDC